MPASLKLQEAFGDDLQVVFVEVQGATLDQAEAFAISKRWMGGRAFWTIEPPFLTGASMLPNFVLLGSDGKVLLKGNPFAQSREIERRVAEEIRKQREPPPDVHPAVRSAWSEFRAQHVARALGEVRKLASDADATPEVRVAAASTLAVFQELFERDLARASALFTHGSFDDAAAEVDRLQKAVHGDAELEQRLAGLADQLSAPDLALERESARTLQRLSARFFRSGGARDVAAELTAFAEQNPGTSAAKRASHLARLARR